MKKTLRLSIMLLTLAIATTTVHATIYSVIDTADTTATGTLRWAIAQCNANGGLDTLRFSVSGPISVGSILVAFTDQVIVEGNGVSVVANGNYTIFTLGTGASGSIIRNLCLKNDTDNQGTGIVINGDNNQVYGCMIGTDWADVISKGFNDGISISGIGNLIGGNSQAGQMNVISNCNDGIEITSDGNSVCGNVIGLSDDQGTDLGNNNGVNIDHGDFNAVGLPTTGWGNVISGNGNYGIWAYGTLGTTIQNNVLGLNTSGTAFPNTQGLLLYEGAGNLVGGNSTALQGNVISGNSNDGVQIQVSYGNSVCGNVIGLNAAQNTDMGNNESGVRIDYGTGNVVGLPISGWGNVISGNDYGINLQDATTVTVQNNLIGVNASGTAFSNDFSGLAVYSTTNSLIGGKSNAGANEGNVIAGNGCAAYIVASHNNVISGNTMNTSPDGTSQVVDASEQRTMYMWGSAGNLIGGLMTNPNDLRGNIIVGQTLGFQIRNGSNGNTIMGNSIGVLADGSAPAKSYTTGIFIENDSNNNKIGLKGGNGNRIVASATGTSINSASGTVNNNGVYGNQITGFSIKGIDHVNGGNNDKGAPTITSAVGGSISGTTPDSGDYIEIFRAPGIGNGGSLEYLGSTTAGGTN
jgi:hypothetical protein